MLRGGAFDHPTTRDKEEGLTRSSPLSSCGAKVSDFTKTTNKVETSSKELNMHFIGVPYFTSMEEEGCTGDSPLGSLSDLGVVMSLGETKTSSITRTKQVSTGSPFGEGGILLCPMLLEGPLSTFFFFREGKIPIDKARDVKEEEERTVVDTTKVFFISMGFGKGYTFGRNIRNNGSTKGVMNTYIFLGSGALALTMKAESEIELV